MKKDDEWNFEGQMTIFDYPELLPEEQEPENVIDIIEILEYDLLKGTGFVDGKKRVYEFFENEPDKNKRIKFLKQEYGIGGGSGLYKDINYWQNHDANGIDIKPKVMIGKTSALHSEWPMVEKHIDKLIADGVYYEKPKVPSEEPKSKDCKCYTEHPYIACTHNTSLKFIKENKLNLNIACKSSCCYECQDKCRYRCYVVRAEENKKENKNGNKK